MMRHKQIHPGVDMRASQANRQRGWLLVTAAMLLSLCTGIAQAQFGGPALGSTTPINEPLTPTTDAAILYPVARDVQLYHGDLITVHVFGTPDYEPTVRVSLDGTVDLPLIGSVQVDGLTVHQAEKLIASRLSDAQMYRSPQVTIQIVEAPDQVATVTGELHGVIPIVGERRLYDVLAVAGGLTTTSSHTIAIDRPGLSQPIIVDLGVDPAKSKYANVPIFPRDTIVISRVGVVYLLGAFKTQGPIPIVQNSPLTLMQVAAIGGGPGFEGRKDDLRIIRTIGLERHVVHVDINKVFKGEVPDPVLQPDDIVFLPTSAMKAAIKSGGLSTLLGIASVLVIAVENR
jgi:polysaccharide export outer membrane protein